MDASKPVWRDEKAAKLLGALLSGMVVELKPQIDPDREMGYYYPEAAKIVSIPDKELLALLEGLAKAGILERVFSENEALKLPNRFPDSKAVGYVRLPILHGEFEPTSVFDRIKRGDFDWISEEFMVQGYID